MFKNLSTIVLTNLQLIPNFAQSDFSPSSAILKSELTPMSTPAFIDAHRRNEILNAGSRSEAGIPSTTPVLAFEDKVAYQTLVETLTSEFNPQTEHEAFLVQQMVEARWRLSRIRRIETAAFDVLLGDAAAENPYARLAEALQKQGGDLFSKLERFAAAAERSYHKAHKELQTSLKPRKQQQAAAGSRRDDALLQLVLGPPPVCKTKPILKSMEEDELELLTRPVPAASPKPGDGAV